MPSIAIISKPQKPELSTLLPELVTWLEARGYTPVLDENSAFYTGTQGMKREQMPVLP